MSNDVEVQRPPDGDILTLNCYPEIPPKNYSQKSRDQPDSSSSSLNANAIVCSGHHTTDIPPVSDWNSMREEWLRLASFSRCPLYSDPKVSLISLASKGFVYVGNGSNYMAACYFCLVIVEDIRCIKDGVDSIQHQRGTNKMDCPMVGCFDDNSDDKCDNVPIRTRFPKDAPSLLSQFLASRFTSRYNSSVLVDPGMMTSQNTQINNEQQNATLNSSINDTRSSSQSMDTNSLSSLVTTITDIEENWEAASVSESIRNDRSPRPQASSSIRDHDNLIDSSSQSQSVESDSSRGSTRSSVLPNNTDIRNNYRAHRNNTDTGGNRSNDVSEGNSTNDTNTSTPNNTTEHSTSHTDNNGHNDTNVVNSTNDTEPNNVDGVNQENLTMLAETNSPATTNGESSNNHADTNATNSEPVTYEKLGILTSKPKSQQHRMFAARLNSYNDDKWPKLHHLKPEDLANAGFYFTGVGDSTKCFHCGGGLRHWEAEDNALVEHARWFSRCDFLIQKVGKEFVAEVQAMKNEMDVIKYEDVLGRIKHSKARSPLNKIERMIASDAAVLALCGRGFDKSNIMKLATEIYLSEESLSADSLYQATISHNLLPSNPDQTSCDSATNLYDGNTQRNQAMIESLRKENSELRQELLCKICMDYEISVVFLPCGHFVSCTECSVALQACPVCRLEIKGLVNGYL